MAYKIDVLISFAEDDNQPSGNNENGWVSDFKYFLELMLEQVIGEKPTVLLKPDSDTITGADMKDVAILMPILSPYYLASGQCLDLLEEFGKLTEKSKINRIFKVMKSPLPHERQPVRVREKIGYEVFKMDMDTGVHSDYKDYFNDESANAYWMQIVDISFDLHETLIEISGKTAKSHSLNERRTVYLAETAYDLTVQRNIIKRELQRHGYKILPDHSLPNEMESLETAIKEYIDKSDMSIHLIGTSYGDIPEGTEKSIVDIQNKIAAEKGMKMGKFEFPRLIWITPSLRTASEKQRTFIENVKRASDVAEGTEILQTPLEDFKNIIREDIIEGGIERKKVHSAGNKSNGRTSVYLIHDKIDIDKVKPIKSSLEKAGFNILEPKFEGELLDVRENHIENLREFDAAIIFQEDVNRQWVRMKLLDLMKAPGFGRNKPMKGRALIGKTNSGFENFADQGITLIKNDKNMAKSLDSFLEDIK